MSLTDEERKKLKDVCANGPESQKRAAKTALGSRLTGDASYRYKIREKLREGGVEAFEEDRRGRPIDVELREEVRLAIKLVQENIVRPTRSDYKTEIAARLNRPISEAALTRYLSANKVQIRPQKKAKP